MLKKVAVDRFEINKLIRLKRSKEAKDYINHVRSVIEMVAVNRVNKFLENKIILKEEKNLFLKLIENNLNNKLLEEKNYILVDEDYIDRMGEQILYLKHAINRKKIIKRGKTSKVHN